MKVLFIQILFCKFANELQNPFAKLNKKVYKTKEK